MYKIRSPLDYDEYYLDDISCTLMTKIVVLIVHNM